LADSETVIRIATMQIKKECAEVEAGAQDVIDE
jgi:hypothetical protein